MRKEVITLSKEYDASLTCYLLDVKGKFVFEKRGAVVVMPGGAYAYCSDREGDPVAFGFMKAGYHVFILRYTCKDQAAWPQPLNDYEMAMDWIAENAEKYGIDTKRIATIGFSAGGHLAACTATIAQNKPAASILVYPALDRDIIDLCMPNLPEPRLFVDENTAPCFMVAARNDDIVDVKSIVHFQEALIEHCIPFESHIYSFGGHGFSVVEDLNENGQTSERLPHWFAEALGWLEENLGKQSASKLSSSNENVRKNADSSEQLSVDCSVRYVLKQQSEASDMLMKVLEELTKALNQTNVNTIIEAFGSLPIRHLLQMAQCSDELIDNFDRRIREIKKM